MGIKESYLETIKCVIIAASIFRDAAVAFCWNLLGEEGFKNVCEKCIII